jgi:maltose alpha-D-glucosyltransferase/alpha-amylase
MPDAAMNRDEPRRWVDTPQEASPQHVLEAVGPFFSTAEVLGRRTGEMHVALASAPIDPAFPVDPFPAADIRKTAEVMRAQAVEHFHLLDRTVPRLDERRRQLAADVLAQRDNLLQQYNALENLSDGGRRIRCHGDYHLGQVLVSEGDVIIIDFEGEPARPLAERRRPSSPLRDVAGMLRSFSYAALAGVAAATQNRPEDVERLAPWAEFWEAWISAAFLRAYVAATAGAPLLPAKNEDRDTLLNAFVLDKALYELGYELNNRPEWVHIPLTGLLRLRSLLHA